MTFRTLLLATAAFAVAPAFAADDAACAVPGVTIIQDATGDAGLTPDSGLAAQPVHETLPLPVPEVDIESISVAEPVAGKLVFTYKVAGLSNVPPQTAWIVRFSDDEFPADGYDDFFVAMLAQPDPSQLPGTVAAVHLRWVYGRTGFSIGLPAGEPRQFVIDGELEEGSAIDANGTITLVLDTAKVAGIHTGTELFNIIASVRLISFADGTPFFVNGGNTSVLDLTDPPAIYDVTGAAGCPGKSGSGFVAGALSPLVLLMLGFGALRRRG